MKKNILVIVAMSLIMSILAVGCGEKKETNVEVDSLQYIQDKGTLVLGLDDAFPPMGFRDDSGEVVGFDIDLAKQVAKRMGVELEIKPIDWDSKVFNLNNKDIDVIWNGLSITDERKEKVDFSRPYINNSQIIITNASSDIKTKDQLAGKVLGAQLGSSAQDAVEADTEVNDSLKELRKFESYTLALMDLEAGNVDAVVIDEIVGRYYISKKPDLYKVATDDFGKEEYGIGFRKGDTEFVNGVNEALEEMIEDGTAKAISEKWFGENIMK